MKKSISIPDELAEQIEILRAIQGRSFSNCVVFAVRSEIKKQAGKIPGISRNVKIRRRKPQIRRRKPQIRRHLKEFIMGKYNMALIWQSHEAKLIRKANESFIRTGKLDPEITKRIELCREAFKRTATAGR